MTGATIPTFGAILVQLALGLAVFQANRHRLANQCFLLLSLIVGAWLGSIYLAFVATNPQVAEFAIRQASATGVVYLATLNLCGFRSGGTRRGGAVFFAILEFG